MLSLNAHRKQSGLFGATYLHNESTPIENLRDQEIFMACIAIFLILIYLYLLYLKRKRLLRDKAESEDN